MDSSRIYKTEAIILKRKNIGEADRILTIFTKEYGKLKVLAKGIRRITSRRSPHLEVFTYVRLVCHHGKTMDMISEAETIEPYVYVRHDLARVGIGYYFCELIDTLLADNQEHQDVFILLKESLQELNNDSKKNLSVFAGRVSFKLLDMLGFLAKGKEPLAKELVAYIERIAEKRLKTPKFYRLLTRSI